MASSQIVTAVSLKAFKQRCRQKQMIKTLSKDFGTKSSTTTTIPTRVMSAIPMPIIPHALSAVQRAALEAGTTLTFRIDIDNDHDHNALIRIEPLPSSSSSTTFDRPFLLPTHLGSNRHLRIWSRNPSNPSNSQPLPEGIDELVLADNDNYKTFAICGLVKLQHAPIDQHQHIFLGCSSSDGNDYTLLNFNEASDDDELDLHKPAAATRFGPNVDLPSLFSEFFSNTHPESVTVAFAAQPLPERYSAVTPFSGTFRGFRNLPPLALRMVVLDRTLDAGNLNSLSNTNWEQLLTPIGKQVDLLCKRGTVVSLSCREVYNPTSEVSVFRSPTVLIVAKPESSQSAQNCMYQVQHILCMYGYNNIGVTISVGHLSRALSDPPLDLAIHDRDQLPYMSTSIGLLNKGHGRLGGYVHFSQQLCVMTAHHVLVKGTSKLAYNPNHSMHLSGPVECPPKAAIDDLLKQETEAMQKAEEVVSQASTGDNASSDISARSATDVLATDMGTLSILEYRKANLYLGHPIASSGLINTSTHREHVHPNENGLLVAEMDWALVKVDQVPSSDSRCNKIHPSINFSATFRFTRAALRNGELKFGSMKSYLNDGEKYVAKIDCYKNVSYGTLSTFRTRVYFADTDKDSLVYEIPPGKNKSVFGLLGDSGSWVLGTSATAIGLFVGVSTSPHQACYAIDMEEVLQDIRIQTGMLLLSPTM